MRQTIAFLFATVVCMAAGDALAQPATVQADTLTRGKVTDPDIYFLSAAPVNRSEDGYYRISFLKEEIYYSIVVEQITFRKTEGDTKEVLAVHKYSGFDVGEKLSGVASQLVDLQFVEWTSWNTFVAREGDKRFRVQVEGGGTIQVERAEGS